MEFRGRCSSYYEKIKREKEAGNESEKKKNEEQQQQQLKTIAIISMQIRLGYIALGCIHPYFVWNKRFHTFYKKHVDYHHRMMMMDSVCVCTTEAVQKLRSKEHCMKSVTSAGSRLAKSSIGFERTFLHY